MKGIKPLSGLPTQPTLDFQILEKVKKIEKKVDYIFRMLNDYISSKNTN